MEGGRRSGLRLAGLAVARLIDETGLTSLRRYDEELAHGRTWRSAFATAFGQTPTAFYAAFAAQRETFVLPNRFPPAFASVSPTDRPAPVTLTFVTPAAAPGTQALIRAESLPAARCTFVVSSPDGEQFATHATFVDGAGKVFWLWSIPATAPAGTWPVVIACGGAPVETALHVQPETGESRGPRQMGEAQEQHVIQEFGGPS